VDEKFFEKKLARMTTNYGVGYGVKGVKIHACAGDVEEAQEGGEIWKDCANADVMSVEME